MEEKQPCPFCLGVDYHKNGFSAGRQRYLCRGCHKNFSVFKKGNSLESRYFRRACQLYLEGVSFRAIERILGIGHVTALYWVRKHNLKIPNPETKAKVRQVKIDELCRELTERKEEFPSSFWCVESKDAFFLFR